MDEAEKYKQRLEAIAEKRRQQEEEDKARREMEDEKLRLQQLKRKSLRDQWLMEGAPLSPRSPGGQAPRSPSWDVKKDGEKLQLQEEQEPTEVEEVVNVEDGGEAAECEVTANPRAAPEEAVLPSINGTLEPHGASATNGPVGVPVGVGAAVGRLESEQRSSGDEPEPDRPPDDQIDEEEEEEEEEGTLVMRAECVIITDEGDEASQEDEEAQRPSPEEEEEEEEGEVEAVNRKPVADSEKNGAAENGGGVPSGVELVPHGGGGGADDGDIQVGSTASVQLQSSAGAPEGAVVASVPVYCQGEPTPPPPPSAVATEREAKAAAGVQAALCQPGGFQDVSLTDPQDNNRTEEGPGPGEGEPLLSGAPVPGSTAELAGVQSPASTETHSPVRAQVQAQAQQDQAQQDKGPKRKTCQCCSVM